MAQSACPATSANILYGHTERVAPHALMLSERTLVPLTGAAHAGMEQ
jgi:hypothetical protein